MKLGDRMKCYEETTKQKLLKRTPTIIRVDGKAFHTWTKRQNCTVPFSASLRNAMVCSATNLLEDAQNAVFAYTQSDEISVLLKDWTNFDTEQWFAGSVQKIASVSASIVTVSFNQWWVDTPFPALFDARVFQVPKEEVANYFIWRQKDAMRNSISMAARARFGHHALVGKNTTEMKEMLTEAKYPWESYPPWQQRGTAVRRIELSSPQADASTPIFTEDREYIEQYL